MSHVVVIVVWAHFLFRAAAIVVRENHVGDARPPGQTRTEWNDDGGKHKLRHALRAEQPHPDAAGSSRALDAARAARARRDHAFVPYRGSTRRIAWHARCDASSHGPPPSYRPARCARRRAMPPSRRARRHTSSPCGETRVSPSDGQVHEMLAHVLQADVSNTGPHGMNNSYLPKRPRRHNSHRKSETSPEISFNKQLVVCVVVEESSGS